MTVYKVSYVEIGVKHPGAIVNSSKRPEVSERVQLGSEVFKITEVFDLYPPRGNFYYIHASCKPFSSEDKVEEK
jgi:hypothetical protein